MPKVTPPRRVGGRPKAPYRTHKNRTPATLRVNSTRALRLRALAAVQAAELGVISTVDGRRLVQSYRDISEMMLAEHELKQAGIRDEVPDDNAPAEEHELVLGTHEKQKAVVKRVPGKDGQLLEEHTVTVERSGVDGRALSRARYEHQQLLEERVAEALDLTPEDEDD